MKKLILHCNLCPGDVTTMTAAVRDLHAAYPGEYATDVRTPCPALWEHNPHITQIPDGEGEVVPMHYDLVKTANQLPLHMIHGYRDHLQRAIRKPIPPGPFRGDIHLGDQEKRWISQVEESHGVGARYWIVNAGGKKDYTAKVWSTARFQAVVDHFKGRILFVQVGESGHDHPALSGVLDLRGKTDLRQFVRLMYHADGVLCGVTAAMHLAAAVPTKDGSLRPCVVVAGAREPAHWEQYPGHRFLENVGALDCCRTGACWRSRTVALGDGKEQDQSLCAAPVKDAGQWLPKCLGLITPEQVIGAIEPYAVAKPKGPVIDLQVTPAAPAIVGEARLYPRTPKVGLVIGTYDALPYIHLQLAVRYQLEASMRCLVIDDGSPRSAEIRDLCAEYGAQFHRNPQRLGHVPGDMQAFITGHEWARDHRIDLLVKFSRRWIPLVAWRDALVALARDSEAPTLNNRCVNLGFGFRSECVAMSTKAWNETDALAVLRERISDASGVLAPEICAPQQPHFLVEGIVHQAACVAYDARGEAGRAWEAEHPALEGCGNYAPWPLMGESRHAPRAEVLWHEWARAHEYHRALLQLGVDRYRPEDFTNPAANIHR